MTKTEIICDSCDNHYVIITSDEELDPIYCPFCNVVIEDTDGDE